MSNPVVDPNGNSGVFLADVQTANVSSNTITRPNFSGIVVTIFCGPVPSNVKIYSNSVSGGTGSGVDVRATAFGGATSYSNTVTNFALSGILYGTLTSGNYIYGNTATGNGPDCRDSSVGSGTSGTANTWYGNRGNTSVPPGLCV
jgi:hypothetical protein